MDNENIDRIMKINYNDVNADVISNKEIQKATGVSPAAEKRKIGNGRIEYNLVIESWKTGWRIKLTREFIEDFMGYRLNLPPTYTKGARNFDTGEYYYYPFPIALFVAFKNFAVYHLHNLMRYLQTHETVYRRHKRELEEAYKHGYLEGRDFEFRTMKDHAAGMKAVRNSED